MADIHINMSVQERAPMTALYEEHSGAYNLIGAKFDVVVNTGKTLLGLPEAEMLTLGIYYNDPYSTPVDQLRSRACLVLTDPQAERAKAAGKNVMIVPGGKYAVGHCTIGCEQFGPAWAKFMEMLPTQGLKSDTTRTCYEAYVGHDRNTFTLDLCEPIL
ncbi:hypothetical protein Pelo_3542 [Pelomyxa schiedti]|nr:hypothetical protein Pelo_3542 [Pelomyxa schiedti]